MTDSAVFTPKIQPEQWCSLFSDLQETQRVALATLERIGTPRRVVLDAVPLHGPAERLKPSVREGESRSVAPVNHLDVLGKQVEDKVTGFKGVATSVCYDVNGCVQVIVKPRVNEAGDMRDGKWCDIGSIKVIDDDPVLESPDFVERD